MSTTTSGIEGVSARYAAQIRELIYEQAMKRLVARRAAQREQAQAIREAVKQAQQETRHPAPGKQQPAAPASLAAHPTSTAGLIVNTTA